MTAARFVAYLEVYVLALVTGAKALVMDNLPVHRAKAVREFLRERGVRVIHTPPYSPEFNPIEEAFAKVKGQVRRRKPRTGEALCRAIRDAVKSVTPDDATGFINHSEEFLPVTLSV